MFEQKKLCLLWDFSYGYTWNVPWKESLKEGTVLTSLDFNSDAYSIGTEHTNSMHTQCTRKFVLRY